MAGKKPVKSKHAIQKRDVARKVRQGHYTTFDPDADLQPSIKPKKTTISPKDTSKNTSNPENLRRLNKDKFKLVSEYEPKGDQPEAIQKLVDGLANNISYQHLLGVTGSGKTYTIAKVIEHVQRPTIVIAHNKTLAAQLCSEFRQYFPKNAVEYFVSYYDYYQPEAYIPSTDTYIEKDAQINEEIDRLRHAATEALLTRRDVIIVASVSCIYGLGSPEDYAKLAVSLKNGEKIDRQKLIRQLVDMQYMRNQYDLVRGSFRIRGERIEIYAADKEVITRFDLFEDEIEGLCEVDAVSGRIIRHLDYLIIFPASHYILLPDKQELAMKSIRDELAWWLPQLEEQKKLLEHQRLKERVLYDLELIKEIGYCSGIENYSRHFSGTEPGEHPSNLLDYMPDDALIVIDESHQTLPQLRAMYRGDRSRKQTLVEYGFRMPSAMDNRPLKFEEFETYMKSVIFVSATPGDYELEKCEGHIAEQVIRPTGLVDPQVIVHPTLNQIDDMLERIKSNTERKERTLVTTLTKRMAENLTEYMVGLGFKVQYLHSDVDTVERIRILKDLRLGTYDIVVGINLLREGLDLPEVSLICILDADKEGFLRSDRSLIQIIGRAARNINGTVILYADKITPSMSRAIEETNRRRDKQIAHNKENNITPQTIQKAIIDITSQLESANLKVMKRAKSLLDDPTVGMSGAEITELIMSLEAQMMQLAELLEFEKAAVIRDQIKVLENSLKKLATDQGRKKVKLKMT